MVRKRSSTIQLPEDLFVKMDEIKAQWGSSHNFIIEMALRTFLKEDVKMVLKREFDRLKRLEKKRK